MTKAELRLRLAAELRAWTLDGEQRNVKSEAICEGIQRQRAWQEAELVCAFLPLLTEPRIDALWEGKGGPAFCFPRVRGTGVELIRIDHLPILQRGDWRMAGPEFDAAPIIAPETVDLFLIPGLAFTPDGRRLGRGGGYYDRLLPQRSYRSTALGICFEVQLQAELPVEAHDQQVDAVITESGVAPVV